MKHANQPAAIYDLTTVASTLARHNVRSFDEKTSSQLGDIHEETVALLDAELAHKAPVPHTDPELLKAAAGFAEKTLQLLQIAQDHDHIAPNVAAKTRESIQRFRASLRLLESGPVKWLCDPEDIDEMFGIAINTPEARTTMIEETSKLAHALPSKTVPLGIQMPVNEGEAQRIFQTVRRELFSAATIDPMLYTEARPERHYLFWTPTAEGQECAVPDSYSLADHFRFHSPHNDAHLSHLHDLSKHGVSAYTDFMDERAFFEAIAVHSEWQILESLQRNGDGLVESLYDGLESERRSHLSPEELRRWMIEMRSYECRLRAARLVADVLTIQDRLPFEEMVQRSMSITGLSREDAESEARKYYFLPGLGAVYTLGYRKMLDHGISNSIAGFRDNGTTIRTWHQFHDHHDS